ncbi:MAG: carboxypeptidase-like regulatory domain-containing protein [Acidobacteriaceae bacterium]|nr:carboxypeptidase-like regulatory domain-containing protein [Acidobacteriaceae bacterium]
MALHLSVLRRSSAAFALLLTTLCVHAQQSLPSAPKPQSGTVLGNVIDADNDLVPNATVVLTENNVAAERLEMRSDAAGHFEFHDVPPGTWTLHVTAPELRPFEEGKIVVHPGGYALVQGIVLNVAATHADVTVTMTTEQVAEQEMHDEEKQRVLAIFPNFNTSYVWNAAPLNARQKMHLSLRAVTDPAAFITAGIVAGSEQVNNTFPGYGDGASGFGKRYGAAYGDAFIGRMLGYAVFPAIFRQDPRYFYMGPGSPTKERAYHAIASGLLCRGNNGHTQINYSHLLGNFTAGYISSVYHPDQNNAVGLAARNTVIGIGGTAVVNLVREFVLKAVSTGVPKYGKGKPTAESSKELQP